MATDLFSYMYLYSPQMEQNGEWGEKERERWLKRKQVIALDLEAISAPGQAKAGGLCAIVAQENGEMKVLFKQFVLPVHGDLSMC